MQMDWDEYVGICFSRRRPVTSLSDKLYEELEGLPGMMKSMFLARFALNDVEEE